MNLSDIRKDIDRIDSEMLRLIAERMECSKRVAEYKRENGMAVFDAVREKQILDSLSDRAGEYGKAVRMIYSTIMEQSKALQYPQVENAAVREFEPLTPHEKVKKIACQGVAGAYSSLVGRELYPNAEITYCASFSDVCALVRDGKVEYGILPVENSWAGSVHEVYDLLINGRFLIAECIDAHIKHNLIGTQDADICDVKRVLSHPQALRQCADIIEQIGAEPTECTNTAVAVQTVGRLADKTVAAIGSAAAAKQYGLKILKPSIATSDNNTTRFISISSFAQRGENADKISIVFSVDGARESGALLYIMERFASCDMSITKLESRPLKGSKFEYVFYIDLIGNLDNGKVAGVLATLASDLPDFVLLGNYHEGQTELE